MYNYIWFGALEKYIEGGISQLLNVVSGKGPFLVYLLYTRLAKLRSAIKKLSIVDGFFGTFRDTCLDQMRCPEKADDELHYMVKWRFRRTA